MYIENILDSLRKNHALKLRRALTVSGVALLLAAGGCKDDGQSAVTTDPGAASDGQEGETTADARVYPDPPGPSEPRPVNFPDIQQFELPNKMQVYVVENHEVPLVDVRLVVKVGDVNDPLLATMTASMIGEGTSGKKKLTKAKLDEKIESAGASLNAGASTNNTSIGTRVMAKDLGMALGLVADMAAKPTLPADSLDKIKEEQKAMLLNIKSDGASLGEVLLYQKLYPEGHPYGRPLPTDAEIDAITLEDIEKFHAAWYRANNAYLILSGDVDKDTAEKAVRKAMGMWEPGEKFPEHPLSKYTGKDYQEALPEKVQVHVVDRSSISAEMAWGNLSMARNHDDWVRMEVLNRFFGSRGNMGTRLFTDIRETRKLTYNISAQQTSSKTMGEFVIRTQTKKVDEMLNALFEHVDRVRTTDPSDEEFEAARNALALQFPLEVETAQQIAGKAATSLTYGLPDDYFKTYRDKVLGVKKSEMQSTATKYIHSVPVIVIVGKRSKIDKQLGRVDPLKDAEIFHYDTDLAPVK
jgi:predicted Zn-dependent peptidase